MSFRNAIVAAIDYAITALSERIEVFDVDFNNETTGHDINNKSGNYYIYGVIQPSDEETIDLNVDGAIGNANFMLHTSYTLQIANVNDVTASTVNSFVNYEGNRWKINGSKIWNTKTGGVNKYILTKYTDNNNSF